MVKTHWKKLHNPDYLGAYSLDPGKDIILTIKDVKLEMVTGPDNRKEECTVVHFVENQKPMILNVTNAKIIAKLYASNYIEDWAGRKIQIYSAKIKAFGEEVEALRIRARAPKQETVIVKCSECEQEIKGGSGRTAEQIAQGTYDKYGKALCIECGCKENDKTKMVDPLGGATNEDN